MAVRLILNALVIGTLNLASFVIGFWIFRLGSSGKQILVQGTAAVIRQKEKAPRGGPCLVK